MNECLEHAIHRRWICRLKIDVIHLSNLGTSTAFSRPGRTRKGRGVASGLHCALVASKGVMVRKLLTKLRINSLTLFETTVGQRMGARGIAATAVWTHGYELMNTWSVQSVG